MLRLSYFGLPASARRASMVIGAVMACTVSVAGQSPAAHAVDINSIDELKSYFKYSPTRDVIISGHRGGMMEGYPENCIESCEKTLSLMPSFFEIDFCFSSDSVPMLMHDLTIDRTTNGRGAVSDYTAAELKQFYLVDRKGNRTPYRIPTLKEMLEWGKDKVVFNFDNKYINTRGVSDEAKRGALEYYVRQLSPGGDWSMYHNIMLSVRSLDEALFYWNRGIRNVIFCVEISKPEHFEAYDNSPIPWDYLMAYIRTAVNPEMQDIYNKLHELGVMTMISVAGSSDKIKNKGDRRTAYMRDLMSGTDIIETDYPAEFVGLDATRQGIDQANAAAAKGRKVKPQKD